MADNWQETTSQQVKLVADRLNELLSTGLNLLHSELGLDLGLKPELYPPWVILLAGCIGLVLMVALWASACRGVFKKRPTITTVDDSTETKSAVTKPTRNEEPKKKKRKTAEKKLQSNGRAVTAEPQEEVLVIEDAVVPHHPPTAEVKTDKALELKKTKKKPKQAVKEVKTATAHGKEPEEGTWETKVSNKEKREQRRKDKTPGDGSGSPGGRGGDPPPNTTPWEQPKAASSLSTVQKKKKGEPSKARDEKEDILPQVDSSEAVEVSADWTDLAVTGLTNAIGPGPDHWEANQSPALGTPETTSLWGQETEGSWTVIDATGISYPEIEIGSAAVEPLPATGLSWSNQSQVVDEWSGPNGQSADPSSDWNAPSEAWVNEEEPPREHSPLPQEELLAEPAKVSDEEKDKADSPPDGNGKSKKKKKKKKKQVEDGGVAGQEGEQPEREVETGSAVKKQLTHEAAPSVQAASAPAPPAAEGLQSQTPPDHPPQGVQPPPDIVQVPRMPAEAEPTAKQNNLPAPTQTEEKPSKTVKKKKARRET